MPVRHAHKSAARMMMAFTWVDNVQTRTGRRHRSARRLAAKIQAPEKIVQPLRPVFEAEELRRIILGAAV